MKKIGTMAAAAAAVFICTGVAAEETRSEPVNGPVVSEQANDSGLLDKLIDLIRATDRGGSP